jgi:16S rRNA (adenine1518-N6/adenine1519-N6)-dimethyltransferase
MSPPRTVKRNPQRKARLGQNFLIDRDATRRIVEALGDVSQKTVIEIGPGKGAITHMLAGRARQLIAVEFDRRFAAELGMQYGLRKNVEIIEADVLAVNLDTLVPEKADVVGNLPYYITSDILLKLFDFHHKFDTIVIMVQKEVADRIAARPGSRDYGLLTVTTQLFSNAEKLFTLPPSAFSPPPKVHSTVLRLHMAAKADLLGVDADKFLAFLKLAFALKRKTLLNNLKSRFPAVAADAIHNAGLRSDVRAEAASLEELAKVFKNCEAATNAASD